jgi:hypothetical protein
MPELQALHYAGWAYGHRIIGELPDDRYIELMELLEPFMRDVKPFQADLVFDRNVIEDLRMR